MTLRRTLATAVAAAALVAPAAQAQPADMHASDAQPAAKARQQPEQDLRTPDARDAAVTVHRSVHVVKAPPAMAADGGGGGELAPAPAVNAPGATAVDSASELPPAGQPTWPVDPQPIVAPAQDTTTDDGSPFPVIPLVAGLLGVILAASAARYGVRRAGHGTRVA